jgi:flagellar hook assembly protein FlgD
MGVTVTGIDDGTPVASGLKAENYPNPFNPSTTIRVTMPAASDVTVSVYDVNGQLIKTLASEHRGAGIHNYQWDATNNAGHVVSSGVYFYKVVTNTQVLTRKMMLLK